MNFILNTGTRHDDTMSNKDLKNFQEINLPRMRNANEVSFKK